MPHATLAICDLNAAVAAKDNYSGFCHTQVCLLAQFAKRVTGKEVKWSTKTDVQFEDEADYNFAVYDVRTLVSLFDAVTFEYPQNIAKIRRALPLDVEYQYNV